MKKGDQLDGAMPLGSKFAWGRVKMRSLSDANSVDQVFDWGDAHSGLGRLPGLPIRAGSMVSWVQAFAGAPGEHGCWAASGLW